MKNEDECDKRHHSLSQLIVTKGEHKQTKKIISTWSINSESMEVL